MKYFLLVSASFLVLLSTTGCASHKQDLFTASQTDHLLTDIPGEDRAEVRTGYQVYLSLVSQADIVTDPAITESIEAMGKRLARHAARTSLPYRFTVIRDDRIFASSTPGGFVYITTGMIGFLKYEGELAAVLAHEIGQTQYREIEFTRRKHLITMLQEVSSYATYVVGPAGVAAPKGIKFVNNVLLHDAFPQEQVMDADKLCAEYLHKEGFTLAAWYAVLKRIVTSESGTYGRLQDYQRIRPITEERVKTLKELIKAEEKGTF